MEKSITLTSKQLKDLNATDQIVTADALTIYLEENTTSIISEINNAESALTNKISSSQEDIINKIEENKFNDTTLMSKLDEILTKIGNAEALLNML